MNNILLTILMFILGINCSYSQLSVLDKPINIDAKNITIKEVFKQISEQTNSFFTYNPEFISEEKKITYHTSNTSTKEVLNYIVSDTSLTFSIIEDHIVICKKEQEAPFFISSKNSVSNIIEISGKILNSSSGKPLPFASVGILHTTMGTVANENGVFQIKIDREYIDSTFFVANLGFKTHLIPVNEAAKSNQNYKLIEDFVSIQEVIIRTHDPIALIQKAINNIKINYTQSPVIFSAFYREGVERKKNVMNLSEAVLKIYKAPYRATFSSDKIKVEKSRKIINDEFSDTLLIKLKDGLYSSLSLDIVKHSISFLEQINMHKYSYQTSNIVTFGNKQAYVVSFEQKENVGEILYRGDIYIETETYAIIACDFEFNFKVSGAKPNFVVKKKKKHKFKTVSAKYHLNYRSVNGIYYLNHVRADLEFKAKKKKQFFAPKYKVFLETVIFNIDSVNVEKFHRKEVEKKNTIFIDNSYSYDADFWGENNFIKPEKSIDDALNKIKVKLNYRK